MARTMRGRIAAVALAGTLAFGGAGAAFASEAGMGAGEATDLGAALEQVEGAGHAAATSGIPAFSTVTQGTVSFQVCTDWEGDHEDDGVGNSYGIYVSDSGVLQVITLGVATDSNPDAAIADFMTGMTQSNGIENLVTTGAQDRTLDGVLIKDSAFTAQIAGTPIEGLCTFVFGSQDTTIFVSIIMDDPDGSASFCFQQAHRSVSLASGTTTGTAATSGTGATSAAPADSFEFEGFQIALDTDPAALLRTTVDAYDGHELDGAPCIGVPVSLTNASDEAAYPPYLFIDTYGPSGVEQQDIGHFFDDSIDSMSKMRPGASASGYLYLLDEGAGEYVISFDDWLGKPQEVTPPLE